MIKRSLFLFVVTLLFTGFVFAQTPAPTGTVHSVALTCTAPSPVGGSGAVLGFRFYRSPNATPVNFARIDTTQPAICAFTDGAVTAGSSYLYVATTIDTNGNESGSSNQVTVTVPTNPNAPTGLAGVAHSGEGKKEPPKPEKPAATEDKIVPKCGGTETPLALTAVVQ
jgi:hypothetical protein